MPQLHKRGLKTPKWHIGTVLANMDSFGKQIPMFNIQGDSQVKTVFGGVLSVLVITLTLMYSTMKFIDLMERKNPQLIEQELSEYFETSSVVNLNDINFRMAFTVEGFLDKERKDDPRYIKYMVVLRGREDGNNY